MRIQEAQKHTYLTDADPEHRFKVRTICLDLVANGFKILTLQIFDVLRFSRSLKKLISIREAQNLKDPRRSGTLKYTGYIHI
jgi:hypothetical protein